MLEKNRNILIELIRKLPVYTPPGRVWDEVEQSLGGAPKDGLGLLPSYQPPDTVWDRIESELEGKSTKVRPIRRLLPWAAAVAACLAAAIWFFVPTSSPESLTANISITYSKEMVDPALLQRDWKQDEDAFEMIKQLCANSAFTCTNPDMQTLQTELDELSEAKMALEKALGLYGTDLDLIGQLTQIERQRTALLKRMLDYFI